MLEKDIEEYERVRKDYQMKVADKMGREQWMEYNEILFSAHSCAIERMNSEMNQKKSNSLPLLFF